MRKRLIQSHLSLVDLFLAPSHFLRERYIDWGIPPEKIQFEEYGRHTFHRLPEPDTDRPRNRFGFFGQYTPFKGVDVLLKAMKILADEKRAVKSYPLSGNVSTPRLDAHLWLHGANLDLQAGSFQNEIEALLEAAKDEVTLGGRYYRHELSRLMKHIDWVIIPSIWWENSPLVIQEAFQHGRPVICSNIGGMAEKVTDGVNGLHFRVGDSVDLAQTIRRAAETPDLWEALCSGIPEPYKIEDSVEKLCGIYEALIANYAEVQR